MRCMKHAHPHLMALSEHMARGGHGMQLMMPEAGMGASPAAPATPSVASQATPTPSEPSHGMTHMSKEIEDAVRMAREEAAVQFKRLQDEVATERSKREAAIMFHSADA